MGRKSSKSGDYYVAIKGGLSVHVIESKGVSNKKMASPTSILSRIIARHLLEQEELKKSKENDSGNLT